MNVNKTIRHLTTHGAALGLGFALGIYLLPILIAPSDPDQASIAAVTESASYHAKFDRNRQDSDAFHWGEGTVSVGQNQIAFEGELAPGPDYKLYLSPTFVETEEAFKANKSTMVRLADIKTFNGFVADVPDSVNVADFTTVVVWCETFSQFISSGQYR